LQSRKTNPVFCSAEVLLWAVMKPGAFVVDLTVVEHGGCIPEYEVYIALYVAIFEILAAHGGVYCILPAKEPAVSRMARSE
jgi:hypothetical protein